jgi:hypothetical protein
MEISYRPGSINCPLSRNRLGNEELCEAVENRAAEFLAVDLVEDGEIYEDHIKGTLAKFAVANIRCRRMTLIRDALKMSTYFPNMWKFSDQQKCYQFFLRKYF